jgi:hypothetical protein
MALALAAIGAGNLAGALSAWQWRRDGAGGLAAAWGGLLLLSLVRGEGWGIVLGGVFLVGAAVLHAKAPWDLSCTRCGFGLDPRSTQCRQCGQDYWRAQS